MIVVKVTLQILQVLTVNRSEPTFHWVTYSDVHNKHKKLNPQLRHHVSYQVELHKNMRLIMQDIFFCKAVHVKIKLTICSFSHVKVI